MESSDERPTLTASRLCTRCKPIFRGDLFRGDIHHATATSLLESAAFCFLCDRIVHHIYRYGHPQIFKEAAKPFSNWALMRPLSKLKSPASFECGILFRMFYRGAVNKGRIVDFGKTVTLWQFVSNSPRFEDLALRSSMAEPERRDNTGSEAAFSQALRWYKDCRNNHPLCNNHGTPGEGTFLPSRVLDVSAPEAPKLVATDGKTRGEYATLSHCWGASRIVTLRTGNLSQFQSGILVADLPKTFVEAIDVAKRFGLSYLWIDSLCIIQDSVEDWRKESALMGTVYSNGVLNIMASDGRGSHRGLFRDTHPFDLEHCFTIASWTGMEPTIVHVIDWKLWEALTEMCPINERGWVVQERVLSPRSLHFTDDQLAWECHQKDACEMYPDGVPEEVQSDANRIKITDPDVYLQWMATWSQQLPTRNAGYLVWERIVRMYFKTMLTKPSDRLVAISGVAKRMRTILQDRYLAGLWEKNLPYELMWRKSRPNYSFHPDLYKRSETYRAPSWSWASLEGDASDIRWVSEGYAQILEQFIDVESADATPLSHLDDTGEVSGGQIRLRGRFFASSVTMKASKWGLEGELHVEGRRTYSSVNLDYNDFHDGQIVSVVCVPVFWHRVVWQRREGDEEFAALLLERAIGRPQGWYMRCGTVIIARRVYHDKVKDHPYVGERDRDIDEDWDQGEESDVGGSENCDSDGNGSCEGDSDGNSGDVSDGYNTWNYLKGQLAESTPNDESLGLEGWPGSIIII